VKIICGLGNPGAEYDATRHNVGWWLVDLLRRCWGLPGWRRGEHAVVSEGVAHGEAVLLVKPTTYMNRSGAALEALRRVHDCEPARDLLVVVDDVALDVGRIRIRPAGSSGGHNGLKSVEAALGTQEYARLRIGVGAAPPGAELAAWVLAPFAPDDELRILQRLAELVDGAGLWLRAGTRAVMDRHNR
jgi:peptidyl-tRNA hydrolase, PTH1 family